jgi:hypothetical protein
MPYVPPFYQDVTFTYEDGRPFVRPIRADFKTETDWLAAIHKFNTEVTNEANRAFADQFRKSLRSA